MRPSLLLIALLACPTCALAATDPREVDAQQRIDYERAVLKADTDRVRDLGDSLTDEQRSTSLACVQTLADTRDALERKFVETRSAPSVELPAIRAMHRAFDDCLANAQLPVAHPVSDTR